MAISRPQFTTLKSKYKTQPSQIHTCSMTFPNTCAIRMSEALVATNQQWLTSFKNSGRNVCPHGYMRGAQDLASVIRKEFGPRDLGWRHPTKAPANVAGKHGIICYMNIPGYSGQGHIDLWNGNAAVGSSYWDADTIWMWILS